MALYVSDLLTATAAPVSAAPTSTRTWQWLRGSSAISGATSATYTAVTADIGSPLSASQIEANVAGTATATSAPTETVQAFDPIRLFSASEPGVWYDPSDVSTLFKGPTPVAPVTTPGDTVYFMADKSRGGPGPELVANGNFNNPVTTGWVATGTPSATLSVASGELSINTTSGVSYPGASYTFPTVAGKSYQVTLVARKTTTGQSFVYIADVGGAFVTTLPAIGNSNTDYNFVFVARYNTANVFFLENTGSTGTGTIFADNISVKELPGNHATQATTASQPTYGIVPAGGRRNILEQTEAFNQGVWAKTLCSVDDQGSGVWRLQAAAGAWSLSQNIPGNSVPHTLAIDVKSNGAGQNNARLSFSGIRVVSFTATSEWQRISVTGFHNNSTVVAVTNDGSAAVDILIRYPQFELGSTATPYQRVGTTYDVTEAGVASLGYLFFDGSGDFMSTGTITPGTDKAQVFTGVRKLTDATNSALIEMSSDVNANSGVIGVFNGFPSTGNYQFFSKGAGVPGSQVFFLAAAPITSVLTGLGDISGDTATLRLNGVQVATSATDQGTGNYLAYPLYIGRRGAGGILPFNGHIHSLIVRFGPNLTAARISATESWVASKTAGAPAL